ncbi:MAG: hypothetical protein U0795_25010 [Pirellulales bacterium]
MRWSGKLALVLGMFMAGGCSDMVSSQPTVSPGIFHGTPAEVEQRLLIQIPVGMNRKDAESRLISLGLELSEPADPGQKHDDLIQCRGYGGNEWSGQKVWLIDLDCPDGRVSKIGCECLEISYW